MAYYPAQFTKGEARIRRRTRSRLVDQQKSQPSLCRIPVKGAVPLHPIRKAIFPHQRRWLLSHTFRVTPAHPVGWFIGTIRQAIGSHK